MFKGFKKNDKYFTIAVYAFLVIAASIGLVCVFLNFNTILGWLGGVISAMSSFIYGFIIAYICNAIYKKLHKYVFKFIEKNKPRPKLRKTVSIVTTYIIFIIIISLFIWAIVPSLVSSINALLENLQEIVKNLTDSISEILGAFPFIEKESIADLNTSITEFFAYDNEKGVFTKVLNYLKENLESIAVTSAMVLVNILVGFILSIYFLIYKDKMTAKCKRIMCAFFSEKRYRGVVDFARYSDKIFGRYMLGTLVDSFFVGLIMFIILIIFQFPYAALIAVTCGITNIIPFFGPFIGAIPSALLVLITPADNGGGIFKVLIFVAIVLVLQQIDGNIIAPQIHGASTGLTPIGVIAAVTFSAHVFGFWGMVIGVPLCAIISYYLSKFIDSKLKKKHLPTPPEYYRVADVYDDENFAKARSALAAEEQLESSETLATAAIKDEVLKEIKEQVVEKVLTEALEGITETADAQEKEING